MDVGGPVSQRVAERAPFGPLERLDHERLEEAQELTLATPRRHYSLAARALFATIDRLYGKDRTLEKFRVLEELTASGPRRGWLRSRGLPQVLAFAYYQLSWLLYAVRPAWSYRLNADFEDHAEHEYAEFVREHPEWEDQPCTSGFAEDFGTYDSLADLFRQISHDERLHREESEALMRAPRFR